MNRRKSLSVTSRVTVAIGITATALAVLVCPARTASAQVQSIWNTPMPSVIRVAIRSGNNPRGPILWVQTVDFQEYILNLYYPGHTLRRI